jgi:bifunctional enzyme CysN/CysC
LKPFEIFRVTSAGSVDDGKSTLLARLLLDTGSIKTDLLESNGKSGNLADLLDGLDSERNQGITIDVAHRFFDAGGRRYHLTDSPGHEQYTRNMATACAGSDALILVIDVQAGMKSQTKLHLDIALKLGVRNIVFAINKMDAINYRKKDFDRVAEQIQEHLKVLDSVCEYIVPVSSLLGENVTVQSKKMGWYAGKSLLEILHSIKRDSKSYNSSFMKVECVQRISSGGRRYLGTLYANQLRLGQAVHVNGKENFIKKMFVGGEEVSKSAGIVPASIELEYEQDTNVGDLISDEPISQDSDFETEIIWLADSPGIKGRSLLYVSGSTQVRCRMTRIYSSLEGNAGELASIHVNQILRVKLSLAKQIQLKPFSNIPELGRFVLVDPATAMTVGVGTIKFALRRSQNVQEHAFESLPEQRSQILGQRGAVIWMTGLSGSGKSTLADAVSKKLTGALIPHTILDGDSLRLGMNRDLGFSIEDRSENIRRTAEVAKILKEAGLVVLTALVSPLKADRQMAQDIIGADDFLEIFINTPLEVCESRDPKGLYSKARLGEIPNFTGVNSTYEEPEAPRLTITIEKSLEQNAAEIHSLIEKTIWVGE